MIFYKKIKNRLRRTRGINQYSIDYEYAKFLLKNEQDGILIDVRSKQEYKEKHLEGSINISLYDLERGNYKIENKDKLIILYCEYGKRSKIAWKILKKAGYTRVYQLEGGLEEI